jgi:predicted metal-binding membrane protein
MLPAAMTTRRLAPIPAISMTIVGAWLLIVLAQASGNTAALHHHALIGGDTPVASAMAIFLIAWQIMVVAMMWPASLHVVAALRHASPDLSRPNLAAAAFLGSSAFVWAGFGLAAFVGDVAVHHVVDMTPWLGARPWLIEAVVLAIAGGYQLTPLKRRFLAACRRPGNHGRSFAMVRASALRAGLLHGFDCVGSSWALMLVMFAGGFGSLWPMASLTVLMFYEATGRQGERAATVAGVVLLLAGLTVLSSPLPGGG